MKIALVAPTQIPARSANTMQVMKMAQALAGLGHDVRLAAPVSGAGRVEAAGERDWEALARHYGLRRPFPISWLPAAPALRRYDYGLRAVRWAQRWGADLLYTRLPQAAAFSSLAGAPTLFEIHDLPQGRLGPLFFRLFLRGRGARRLVVITHALAADLAARFERAAALAVIAPDGVDLERYAGLPEPEAARQALALPGLASGRFTAGYTGHLYPGRGAGLLLELAQRLPQVAFLLVGGEPPDLDRVRQAARARGLDNLLLAGFVPNADLPRYQAACDLLLMPYQQRVEASSGGDISRYLSPMKSFEYLACGRAILSSDLPVLREVLSEENALLLPPEDAGAWAQALAELQADPARCAAMAGRAVQDARRYTWEARAEKILCNLRI